MVTFCSYIKGNSLTFGQAKTPSLLHFLNTMISSTSLSSPIVKTILNQDQYTAIPHFPACLGGEWKNLVKTPYLKTTMKFRAGTSLVGCYYYN